MSESMSAGWVRWILEQYHFPFNLIYAKEIDGGALKNKYDVIVFVSGAIPAVRTEGAGGPGFGGGGFEGKRAKGRRNSYRIP